jgi:plasmid stabilization system protein ParE
LTLTADNDFREARQWSLSRWGTKLTEGYFADLHSGAEFIAKNHRSLARKDGLAGATGLGVYAVREHYVVYVPIADQQIAIVALIRQTRDVPAILETNRFIIRREVHEILKSDS